MNEAAHGAPALYDSIGIGYAKHRCAEPRIVEKIIELLGLDAGATLAEIGAGTGNYSRALADEGFHVKTVEPSAAMRAQAIPHDRVAWNVGVAEQLPLGDDSVDGIVCVLAVHHFTSRAAAFREMTRVCPHGPIVVFTHDIECAVDPWFAHYFPRLWSDATAACPSTQELIDTFAAAGRTARSLPFEVPHDIRDAFMASGWRRPEMYLDPDIRRGISGFALSDQSEIDAGLRRLAADIADGTWHMKYADLLARESVDWGYRFVVCDAK